MFLITLSFGFLFGWFESVEDLAIWTPSPPTFVIVHPSTRLFCEARNSTPSLGTPSMTQSLMTLLTDVRLVTPSMSLPSQTAPRERDCVILTRSISVSLPPSKSIASLVVRGEPPART